MKIEDKLQKINKAAAANASKALSKLIDRPVSIEMAHAKVKKMEYLSPIISPEEITVGIYMPITGDVKGAALLIFPKESAFTLSDLLVKREPGTTRRLTELDKSALKEVGNILSGNYLAVLSNMMKIKIIEHIPSYSFDMFGAVISQIITKFAQKAEEALVIEIGLIFKPATCKGYFLLLFELEQLIKIQKLLEKVNFERLER